MSQRGLLLHVPTQAELERLYYEIGQRRGSSVGRKRPWPYRPRDRESLWTLAAEMIRYDPRLLTVLLQWFLRTWHEINPLELRRQMAEMLWPQALLVVLEFVKLATRDKEVRYLVDYLCAGWPRIEPPQIFFFDMQRPGSREARRRVGRILYPYERWGFLGIERPTVDLGTKRTVGRYSPAVRRRILDQLARERNEFLLTEYLDAVDHSVTRQQALRDLQTHPQLEVTALGRSARWRSRK